MGSIGSRTSPCAPTGTRGSGRRRGVIFMRIVSLSSLVAGVLMSAPALSQTSGAVPDSGRVGHAGTGVLRGFVASRNDSTPIRDADVWIISIDRHQSTDSTGAFRFVDLLPGTLLVEVRRIGYQAQRDTLTILPGTEVARRYALVPQGNVLDTVRTIAPAQHYLSPNLRGFEERRASGQGGHFIADSVLRQNENSTLTNIVSARIPGVMMSRGVLVSSRKPCRGPVLQGKGCVGRGGDCYISVYIDGALLYQAQMADRGVSPPDLTKLSVTQFAGVEFYAGGASAPMGMHPDDDGCGTLWLWTRER